MRKVVVVCLTVLLLAFIAGCGSKSSSSNTTNGQAAAGQTSTTGQTHFAKTKFVLHAGLAFGAFHRYIYKPVKEGKFSGGLLHHKLATAKAALAAAFAYHEIRLALNDARSSKILSHVLAPLLALQTKLGSVRDSMKGGKVDTSTIDSANSDTGTIRSGSSAAGQPIQDLSTPQLGG